MTEIKHYNENMSLYRFVLLGQSAVTQYEASAVDAGVACFTYPISSLPSENFIVRYNVTSDEITVHMNFLSIINGSVLRSRRLPARFKQLYEDGKNLTELYDIEFCASSEALADNTDGSSPASAVIVDVKYVLTSSGMYWLIKVAN